MHSAKNGHAHGSDSGELERGNIPRHRAIYEELLSEIQSGVYQPGERLPSEALLCERFNASRITVAKAFENLQREGLVVRRPGSGTYVERPPDSESMRFGVLIPELGTTDIFEPICQGILSTPAARSHSLAWGNTSDLARSPRDGAESLCRQYIAQKVNGVFFAPVEYEEDKDRTNRRIADMFTRANIPVVLLDRCLEPYPDRCEFDLVGIDNHRAGFALTRHLLKAGAKRIVFAARPNSASTVDARAAGYREALYTLQNGSNGKVVLADFEEAKFVKHMLDRERPDGIVCANDVTAAKLMGTIISLGKQVPEDIRMVGVDDVSYAKYLPTPLTTMRQDCAEIGAVAMSVMLERIKRPNHPVMDVRVKTELVVRASCGSAV
jgi:DNA-binding LacI/PurR family transcriptional regulator